MPDDVRYVTVTVDDAVATIRVDRPRMNALSFAVQAQLGEAAHEVTERSDVRAVVLYGGPKVFAAGADIKEMAPLDYASIAEPARELSVAFTALARIPVPVIAAINGFALGGGCELALTADFRVCASDAKLGQPEILLGVIPGAGGTQRLPRLVGVAKAKDLIYSGRAVEAGEALAIGLVDRVVQPEAVYSTALAWARELAAGPSVALRAAKAAIEGGLGAGLARGLAAETELFAALFDTPDKNAGFTSFLANGPGEATFNHHP